MPSDSGGGRVHQRHFAGPALGEEAPDRRPVGAEMQSELIVL